MRLSNAPTLAVLISLLQLMACGSGGDSGGPTQPAVPASAVAQVAALEASGAIPKLDRSSQVLGGDTDQNGVRDDVDAYIAAQTGLSSQQKTAATQSARATQLALAADLTSVAAKNAVALAMAKAFSCMLDRFPDADGAKASKLSTQFEAITVNTPARLRAYIAFNRAMNGTVTQPFEGEACE